MIVPLEILKSTRHQRIIGEFGEYLVCNWLSRSGFEVARVDHTGIDVIASGKGRRLGITVKSRTRSPGTERTNITLFRPGKGERDKGGRQKLEEACEAFGCEAFVAIYVETTNHGDLFLVSLEDFDRQFRGHGLVDRWAMGAKRVAIYAENPSVSHIRIEFTPTVRELGWLNVT